MPSVQPDDLFSIDTVEFILGLAEGPIGGLIDGPKSFYAGDTPIVSAGGTENFENFRIDLYHGDNPASVVKTRLSAGAVSNTPVGVNLLQNVAVIRTTPVGLRNTIRRLEVRLSFNTLLRVDDDGGQGRTSVDFEIQYREAGSGTWLNFYSTSPIRVTGKTSGGYIKEFVKSVPRINNDWEIRVVKLSPEFEDVGDKKRYREMSWESFQATDTKEQSYDNLAVVRGIARASDQFSSVPVFSGIYAGKLVNIPNNYDPVTRYYSGVWNGTFKVGHTDNPVWCLYDLLTNTSYGLKYFYPSLLVDRYSFYDAAKWCDEFVPIPSSSQYQPRWTYSDNIDQARNALELCNYIAGTFGGILMSNRNGTVTLKVDRPANMVQIFAPEGVTEDGFQYQFADVSERKNDILVKFINPHLNWEEDVRRVYDQAQIDANGRIPDEMVAVGCINPYEAQRRAHRRMLLATTEVMTVSFTTTRAGLALEIFDLIGINDPDMNWGLSGRVKSIAGSVITLRDALTVPINTDLTMRVATPVGYSEITVRSSFGTTTSLTITSGTWPVTAPDRALFTLSEATNLGLTKPFRIISIREDDANPELVQITALEHNPNKYGDNDALTSSGTVDYDFDYPLYPVQVSNLIVESGTAHLYKKTDGTIISRIYAYWLHLASDLGTRYQVYYRPIDFDTFRSIVVRDRFAYINDVIDGVEYEIYVRAINPDGSQGPKSASVFHTVVGKTEPPSQPNNVVTIAGIDTITIMCDAAPEVDFKFFRYYASISTPDTPVLIASTASNTLTFKPPPASLYTKYRITSVDTSGNESTPTAWFFESPAGVTNSDLSTEVDDRFNASKSTYTAYIYQRGETRPEIPVGGSFNFGTNVLTPPVGWSVEVPDSDGTPCWVSRHIFSITGDTGTSEVPLSGATGFDQNNINWDTTSITFDVRDAAGWSDPTLLVGDGLNGVSTYKYMIFRRTALTPALPIGGSYDFTNNIGSPPSPWSNNVPSGDDPLWISETTARVDGPTGVDSNLVWSSPAKLVENGAPGVAGQRGPGRWNIQVSVLPTTSEGANSAFFGGTGLSPVNNDQAWFYTGSVDLPTSQSVWLFDGFATWFEQKEVIDGNLLVNGTITANKLQIGSFENLVHGSDFEFQNQIGWPLSTGTPFYRTTSLAYTGSACLRIDASISSGSRTTTWPQLIEVTPGETLYIEFWARRDASWNGLTGWSKLRIGQQDSTYIGAIGYALSNLPSANVWYKRTGTVTIPAGCTRIEIKLGCDATAGNCYIDNIVVRRRSGAVLIEDGAITSDKMAANSITAGNAALANAAVTNAKIADAAITNAKIGTAAITSAKIQDLSVGTLKIAGNAVTSDVYASRGIYTTQPSSWTTILTATFDGYTGGSAGIFLQLERTRHSDGGGYKGYDIRLLLNGSSIFQLDWDDTFGSLKMFNGNTTTSNTLQVQALFVESGLQLSNPQITFVDLYIVSLKR